jgi:DNA-binding transcriptional LysR family regulator
MADLIKRIKEQSGFSIERLVTLCDLEEAGNYANMAPSDQNRQSLSNRQIRALESFLGVEITTRGGHKVQLTNAGKELAREVRLHFKKLQEIVENHSDQGAEFHIGANGTVLEWYVIPRLAELAKKTPELSFRFSDMRTNEVAKSLEESRIDFGVLRSDRRMGKGFATKEVASHGYKIYGPKGGKDLLKMPLALASGRDFRSAIERRTSPKKVQLSVAFECQSHAQCASLVKNGAAASILPDLADLELEGFSTEVPVWLKSYKRKMALAWSKKSEIGSRNLLSKLVIKALTQN